MKELRFLWWNVCDFSHFDAERRARARRPKTEPAYSEKLARIEGAFGAMYGADTPDVIGLTEITMTAALDLKRRLRPDYDVRFSNPDISPDHLGVEWRGG